MPIPQSREELVEQIESSFAKLEDEIESLSEAEAEVICVEDWSVKQLIAVRAWWSEEVVEWIEAGRQGDSPDLPAPGYKWNETPRLNNSIANEASDLEFDHVLHRLLRAYRKARSIIDSLTDHELLEANVFDWAGKWPLSRWISINTARQYTTARTHIRRAQRDD